MSAEPLEQVTAPRRSRQAELIERLLSIIGRSHGDHSSVEISRNSRGVFQFTVSVRTGETDADTVEQAAAKARAIAEVLEQAYPYPVEPEPDK